MIVQERNGRLRRLQGARPSLVRWLRRVWRALQRLNDHLTFG